MPIGTLLPAGAASASGAAAAAARKDRRDTEPFDVMPKTVTRCHPPRPPAAIQTIPIHPRSILWVAQCFFHANSVVPAPSLARRWPSSPRGSLFARERGGGGDGGVLGVG